MGRPTYKTTFEYFMTAFDVCPKSNCWVWNKSFYRTGYGRIPIKRNGKWGHLPAHRVGYELLVGKIGKGLQANHRCDNPACVNPDHIFIGTQLDNMRDMRNKNRGTVGETHPNSLLNKDKVVYIRKHYIPGHPQFGFAAMARRFKVDGETVRDAYTGKTWKWIK